MYAKIMVPVDLAHAERLVRAMDVAADLSKLWDAPIVAVAVASPVFSDASRNPDEHAEKLRRFAAEHSQRLGVAIEPHVVTSPDPVRDLDATLRDEAHELGADLVVMASHVPGWADYVFSSNAGWLASHTDLSVFVVR